MSDLAPFQYMRRAESDQWGELRDRELEDYLFSKVNTRLTSLVTSTTRPTTNLYRGQTIFETDTGNTLVWYGATSGWLSPWEQPWGEVAYVEGTAVQSAYGPAETDITGASVTWTALTGRKYLLVGTASLLQNTAAGVMQLRLTTSANALQDAKAATLAAADFGSFTVQKRLTGLSGSVTYKLRATSSAGTISTNQSSVNPTVLSVVDVGPAANAPNP